MALVNLLFPHVALSTLMVGVRFCSHLMPLTTKRLAFPKFPTIKAAFSIQGLVAKICGALSIFDGTCQLTLFLNSSCSIVHLYGGSWVLQSFDATDSTLNYLTKDSHHASGILNPVPNLMTNCSCFVGLAIPSAITDVLVLNRVSLSKVNFNVHSNAEKISSTALEGMVNLKTLLCCRKSLMNEYQKMWWSRFESGYNLRLLQRLNS